MSEENRIRFAGLMEEYLNIPSFVCELIERQLQDSKYKEVIEYIVQRRNEIENKEDYLSEQEKINRYLYLQQKVEQLEKENIKQKEIIENLTTMTVCGDKKQIKNTAQYKLEQLENIRKEVIEYIKDNACYSEGHCKCSFSQIALDNLLNILNKGENNE